MSSYDPCGTSMHIIQICSSNIPSPLPAPTSSYTRHHVNRHGFSAPNGTEWHWHTRTYVTHTYTTTTNTITTTITCTNQYRTKGHITSDMSYHMLCYVMLCCWCDVMWCHVMLCYVMVCYVMFVMWWCDGSLLWGDTRIWDMTYDIWHMTYDIWHMSITHMDDMA